MFDHKHYVPVIRWKYGERIALRELFPEDKARLTPLLQLTSDVAAGYVADGNVNSSIAMLLSEIKEHWGGPPAFLDLNELIFPSESNTIAAIKRVFTEASYLGLDLVPVTTLNRETWYQTGIRKAIAECKKGVCLRLYRKDVESGRLDREINYLLSSMDLNPPFVDLVVDFQTVTETDGTYYDNLFKRIPLIGGWRTLTVIGGGFPQDLTGLSVGEYLLPRVEWSLWKSSQQTNPSRKATFGDYATLHPNLLAPFGGMNPTASIRYTTDDDWVVMRGEALRKKGSAGFAQFPANARSLMDRSEFCGEEFSYADKYIFDRPVYADKPGNLTTWVTVGVNHHLTFVVRQLADFYGVQIDHRRPQYDLDLGVAPQPTDYANVRGIYGSPRRRRPPQPT